MSVLVFVHVGVLSMSPSMIPVPFECTIRLPVRLLRCMAPATLALGIPSYLKYVLHSSVKDSPTEDVAYATICEFLFLHKNPSERFTIFPQLFLKWKPDMPKDTRAEIPDLGLGNFSLTTTPHIILRLGVEVKRCLDIMKGLPQCSDLEDALDVRRAFHKVYFQGEDQAKAAVKGKLVPALEGVTWLLFIGPYWTSVTYGPFSPAQLTTRTHKPSPSGDFMATIEARRKLEQVPAKRPLYLLGTAISASQLESVIAMTDERVKNLQHAAANH